MPHPREVPEANDPTCPRGKISISDLSARHRSGTRNQASSSPSGRLLTVPAAWLPFLDFAAPWLWLQSIEVIAGAWLQLESCRILGHPVNLEIELFTALMYVYHEHSWGWRSSQEAVGFPEKF